jgi:hypothetical protein
MVGIQKLTAIADRLLLTFLGGMFRVHP